MERSAAEIRRFIKQVVDETKDTARVDTGFLRRSIRGNWFQGMATFRQIFYGVYNDNSDLIDNVKRIMPRDIPWKVISQDEEGRDISTKGVSKSGRTISRNAITSDNIGTSKIKALISSIKSVLNGSKKNNPAKGD